MNRATLSFLIAAVAAAGVWMLLPGEKMSAPQMPAAQVEEGGRLEPARVGSQISVPMADGSERAGLVNVVRMENGWMRVGGALADGMSFSLAERGAELRGMIRSPREGLAWRITRGTDGALVFTQHQLRDLVCMTLPRPVGLREELASEDELRAAPPILSSRPGALHVLYLDFDGEDVSDPDWNSGFTIFAPKARMNARNIKRTWQRVAADYAAFDVDVTTDAARYPGAAVGRRMRCIITRDDTAANGAGGVAYVGSFDEAGTNYSNDIPCWVFIDRNVDACAEAIAHEIGHTFGLSHDGRDTFFSHEEYYAGHGRGATGWAPIMGVGYYRRLTQWSKGEYFDANNSEDDIGIISGSKNGFGFIADEAGSTPGAAATLAASGRIVAQAGTLFGAGDVDVFRLQIDGGKIVLRAKPGGGEGNVDLLFELLDSGGVVLDSSNPPNGLAAAVNKRHLAAGTYYLRVRGTGKGDPQERGYTAYGSIGTYQIVGKVKGLIP